MGFCLHCLETLSGLGVQSIFHLASRLPAYRIEYAETWNLFLQKKDLVKISNVE